MEQEYWLCVLPWTTALIVSLLRTRPEWAKAAALITIGGLLCAAGPDIFHCRSSDSLLVLVLLMAFLSILTQQAARNTAVVTAVILVITGCILPLLAGSRPDIFTTFLKGSLFLVLAVSCRFSNGSSLGTGAGIVFATAGVLSVMSQLLGGAWSIVFQLVAIATLLPLFPFHVTYVGAASSTWGTLPAFLAVAMPCVGWYEMTRITDVPSSVSQVIIVLTVTGIFVIAMRASVQAHLGRIVAACGTLLLSVIWWFFASNQGLSPESGLYLAAVSVAVSGLHLCAYQLEFRYGTQLIGSLPGLATQMPKFGVFFIALVMALLGLPFGAVFSSTIAMLMSFPCNTASDLLFVSTVWFLCSALLLKAMQQLLFRQARLDFAYMDLARSELIALVLIVSLLVAGGLFPGVTSLGFQT